MWRSDRVFRKHQYKDLGIVNRAHDLISVLRPRCYITRRNPAFDPVLLEILDDGIGDRCILRRIAYKDWRMRARQQSFRSRGFPYPLSHTALPTAEMAVLTIPALYASGAWFATLSSFISKLCGRYYLFADGSLKNRRSST